MRSSRVRQRRECERCAWAQSSSRVARSPPRIDSWPQRDPPIGWATRDQSENGMTPMSELDLHGLIRESLDSKKFQDEHWEGSFQRYMELLEQNPLVVRTAHQRLYDMVLSYGQAEVEVDKEKVPSYKFFTDPVEEGRDAVFGLERSLHNLMAMFKAAAHGFGPERRVLLLPGPVGSSKSTIVRLLKKGLEA